MLFVESAEVCTKLEPYGLGGLFSHALAQSIFSKKQFEPRNLNQAIWTSFAKQIDRTGVHTC